MGRSPCCEKVGLKKGPWTPEEDQKLMAYIEEHGHGSWRALPAKAGLQRCGKSCRLRWTNYLRPDIKRGKFSLQEEQTIIQLHALLGNRWSAIAAQLPRRTDNEIKNYWNTHLKKRLTRMGIDPTTHKPKADTLGSIDASHSKDSANLSHMAQWESARLEAEARLVRESKLQVQNQPGSSPSPTQPARLFLNKICAQPSLPPCLDVLKAWKNSWSTTTTTNKDPNNNRMHSMYAMMLSTDETLESPTSTLCFPGSNMLPMTPSALYESNPLIPTADEFNKSSSGSATCNQGAVSTWGYQNRQISPDEEEEEEEEGDHNNALRDHDDIMVAVEAFRTSSSSSCAGAYGDNNSSSSNSVNALVAVPPPMAPTTSDVVGMGGLSMSDHDGMVYDTSCNDDLAIMEEGNKHYWNTILNFVNDAPDMF